MQTSELLNTLASRRKFQRDFLGWLASNQIEERPVAALKSCGSWLLFREWLEHGGETTLRTANFCKAHLLCPGCAARRAGKMIEAYLPKVEQVQQGLHPVMITLTVRNNRDLKAGFDQLRASWSRMVTARRKGASQSGRHLRIEWNKVHGGIRAFEFVRKRERDEWNPHIHCFALIDDWIDREALSAEWQRFTGDSYIVDVRRCKNGVNAGLVEVLKYALKFGDLAHDDRWHGYHVLAGSRLSEPFGSLRGLVPEPEINEDDDSELSGPWREFMAIWSEKTSFYDLRQQEEGVRASQSVLRATRLPGVSPALSRLHADRSDEG